MAEEEKEDSGPEKSLTAPAAEGTREEAHRPEESIMVSDMS